MRPDANDPSAFGSRLGPCGERRAAPRAAARAFAATVAAVIAAGCTDNKPAAIVPAVDAGAPAAAAAPAPLGPLTDAQQAQAKLLVRDNCLACHTGEMLDQQRLTAGQWTANVKKMQGWGALLETEQTALVAAWLASRYGLDAGPYEAAAAAPAEVEAAIAPTSDGEYQGGDQQRGQAFYAAACLSCHGPEAKGAAVGVNLVDRPILYRAAEFAEVVKKGRNKMPEAPGVQTADIASLLVYLRTLKG